MSNQIRISIDCNKIDQSRIKTNEHGRYLDLILIPTPNNQFGSTHLVRQDSSQEERAGGLRLTACGNAVEFFPKVKQDGGFLADSKAKEPEVPY